MELTFLLALLWKHAVVDIGIQRLQGNLHKYNYRSKRAQQHYGAHGIATFLVALFFVGPITALIAGVFDWIAHWHIDYAKSNTMMRFEINSTNQAYWWMLTLDQMLHYLTYYLIILLV